MSHHITTAAIYARSATPDQSGDNTLGLQIRKLQAYCRSKKYSVLDSHVYEEIASGSDYKNRLAMTALREAAKRGEFEIVVIVDYDRIARTHELIKAFIAELATYGIRVESIRQEIPDTIAGQLAIYAHRTIKDTEQFSRRKNQQRG